MKRDLQNPELNSLLPDVQVDRRGFVAACIAAGFAVTAEPLLTQAMAGANQLSDEQAFKDLNAVLTWADKHARANTQKLGVTGFCRGGRMVWMYSASQKKVDAGVAWYGGLSPAEPAIKSTPLDI